MILFTANNHDLNGDKTKRKQCISGWYLAKHKRVEYDGIENGICICTSELQKPDPTKLENQEDSNLIDALTYNIPPHDPSDEVDISSNWWSFHKAIIWWLCGQCQGTKSVHDQVYPKHLDSR